MTRILFLPDPQTIIITESPVPPQELLSSVRDGRWRPPAPYEHLCGTLQVTLQNDLLIAAAFPLPQPESPPRSLPRRELQVLHALQDGLTTRQIALRLQLSPRTVSAYVARLKERFQADTRAELVGRAILTR